MLPLFFFHEVIQKHILIALQVTCLTAGKLKPIYSAIPLVSKAISQEFQNMS